MPRLGSVSEGNALRANGNRNRPLQGLPAYVHHVPLSSQRIGTLPKTEFSTASLVA